MSIHSFVHASSIQEFIFFREGGGGGGGEKKNMKLRRSGDCESLSPAQFSASNSKTYMPVSSKSNNNI